MSDARQSGMQALSCAEVEALAPELAMGTLTGTERAGALVHLETCGRCREMVDELAATADVLLLLAPEAEPPIGFESRTADRIALAAASTRSIAGRGRFAGGMKRLVAVAAVAFIVGAVGAGSAAWWAADHRRSTPAAVLVRTATVDAVGGYTCHAVAVGSNPSWVYVTIEQPEQHDGPFVVQAVTDTDSRPVGTVNIENGRGSIGVPMDVDLHELRSLRVLDADGQVRYEATFTAPGDATAPTSVAVGWT